MIIEMNDLILKDTIPNNNDNKDNHADNGNNSVQINQGTIIIDSTCTPSDITYPQDLSLLNSSREKLEVPHDITPIFKCSHLNIPLFTLSVPYFY